MTKVYPDERSFALSSPPADSVGAAPISRKRQQSIIDYLPLQISLHPSITITDIIKLCYQAANGPEHLLTDKEAARRYLEKEFENTPADDILLCEHISDNICRVNIAAWKYRGLPADDLFALFASSAYPRENAKEVLEGFLREAEEYADDHAALVKTDEINKSADLFGDNAAAAFEEYRRAGMPAIHHSDAYRKAENPAYRVVDSKLLREYFENQ